METGDYSDRSYLSAIEAAKYLGISVKELHRLSGEGEITCTRAASGQMRYDLADLRMFSEDLGAESVGGGHDLKRVTRLEGDDTVQTFVLGNSMDMRELEDESIHLMLTSPPYFNAKMYTGEPIDDDLGDVHDMDEWFDEISRVWAEVYRVLAPGRKAFINIMNLPVRDGKSFRSLNLAGRTVDRMEGLGFIFKRDIIWHKTNGVKAHFGTYPYPGGILLNHMHEFILEFEKPGRRGKKKYGHLTEEQKEASRLDKEFWLELKNSDVWLMKPQASGDNRSHIAPFPYELPYRLIRAYSYVSETVLDPFAGSFVTLKAARDLCRNGVGYEINGEILREALDNF